MLVNRIILKNLLKRIGAGHLLWGLNEFSHDWIEPVLLLLPAAFFYIGLVLAKLVLRKKYVFCWINGFRIGHMAANTELFLRRLKYSNHYDKNCTYIGFIYYFPVCNHQLLNMYRRVFPIIESRFFEKLMNTWIKRTEFSLMLPFNSNEYYEFNAYDPILTFTIEEMKRGRTLLRRMGIGENDWFVCFHARDSKYLGAGSEYHNHRDSNINNYLKAAEYIAGQGGYALRMGSSVNDPLPKDRHPRIIDYAKQYRSDFMDIYLSAHCKFFLGCTAGLHCVPMIFNVPMAGTNFSHLEMPPVGRFSIFLPKKMYDIQKNRLLTFPEIFNRRLGMIAPIGWLGRKGYDKDGFKLIENTANEILGLTLEINELMDGIFQYSEEDNELQSRYRSLIRPHHHCYNMSAKVGALFLRENQDLFV